MPDTQKVRGKVNVVLNRLVREGIISGFRTSFDFPDGPHTSQVTVSVSGEWSPEVARLLVVDALAEVVVGVDVTVACELSS